MTLVVRSNYGDESIALIEMLRERQAQDAAFTKVYVVYIDTGWAAASWEERVAEGEQFARRCGFEVVQLKPKASFANLMKERKSFPSPKFQWCAGFLKGLPLLEWLDERDPAGEWTIALAKRQAIYRVPLAEFIENCAYHGERMVWHPMLQASDTERDQWLAKAGFTPLHHRSLECDPCVNSRPHEFLRLAKADLNKTRQLESLLQQSFSAWGSLDQLLKNKFSSPSTNNMDAFTMGCGDPFACGL